MKRLLVFFTFLFLTACSAPGPAVIFHTAQGNITVIVELAQTEQERATGLMHRTSLAVGAGMLFLFDQETKGLSFWMKNTLIPLDMIFIDSKNKVVFIQASAAPCQNDPCALYSSAQPAQYVLEVNAGFSEAHNIHVGDTVEMKLK